jgi:hypothetical protein|nr:MAG: hypothetical protein [Bacteriophage sp.]UWG86708.1 MAG: hypothetical protein [Bacteriophage sp.]UWG91749.1 MAG: hypothetical protein [Bacteriophage sp.]
MKFLDANGLALFTKKIFSKFVSNVSGADNKITITKGDGTTNEINLNEVLKNDEIAENPPEDDNTLKIPSTSWVQDFTENNFLKKSGDTLSGDLNASGHSITADKFKGNLEGNAKNINYGYNAGSTPLPTDSFRTDVLKLNGVGYSVQPTQSGSVDGSLNNCAGIAFCGGWDTNGFLQMYYNSPRAWVGGGANEKIRWYKELAFKDDISALSNVLAPTMFTIADNSVVGDGWTKNINGIITQITEINLNGQEEIDVQFPISFPKKCLFLDVEIINAEKDTSINCDFHTISKTVDGAKLLKVGTGSPKKIIVKVMGV